MQTIYTIEYLEFWKDESGLEHEDLKGYQNFLNKKECLEVVSQLCIGPQFMGRLEVSDGDNRIKFDTMNSLMDHVSECLIITNSKVDCYMFGNMTEKIRIWARLVNHKG